MYYWLNIDEKYSCQWPGGHSRQPFLCFCIVVFLVIAPSAARSQAPETSTVTVGEGESLRDIAAAHLGDPDLWAVLLNANDLDSVTQVGPGTTLVIPVGAVARADRALDAALGAIQEANREGARLFAPDRIGAAIHDYESGLEARQAGDWERAARRAETAALAAGEALAAALASRDAAAEALLSDREGSVQGRRLADNLWSDRLLNALLIEEELLRTLSRSTAQITFRDDTRLRLNANSQVVIRRMRTDPLSRREVAEVSLVEGDFYALLGGGSARNEFEVDVPDVETDIESRSFWVRHDNTGAKFTNYDDRVLRVAANGESVDLGRNQGALVRRGQTPSAAMAVLEPPALIGPGDDETIFGEAVALAWQPVGGAAGYWLEVAEDQGFDRMTLSRWGLTDPEFRLTEMQVGAYYWRIAGLDSFGLPGARSPVRRFQVRTDTMPPFLAIGGPPEGAILRSNPVRLTAESEPGATLSLDGQPLAPQGDGVFVASVVASPGPNVVRIEARDAAGNVTERVRSFVLAPDPAAAILFDEAMLRRDPRHFITAGAALPLAGRGLAEAQVEVRSEDGSVRATAYSDGEGRFALTLRLSADHERFRLVMTAASGFSVEDGFAVTIDRVAPVISLDPPPPTVTAVEWLPLRGQADEAARLSINGRAARLVDGTFDETVTLLPGVNAVQLVAEDAVGNLLVETFEVVLDRDPPEFVSHSLSRTVISGAPALVIEVVARDGYGLVRAAPFALTVGSRRLSGFLELNSATGRYQATIALPDGDASRPRLNFVELQDYAGNTQRYQLP